MPNQKFNELIDDLKPVFKKHGIGLITDQSDTTGEGDNIAPIPTARPAEKPAKRTSAFGRNLAKKMREKK